MSQSASISSSILIFALRITKYAGEKKIPVLESVLAWTTVVAFGLRYLVDYWKLRSKVSRMARRIVIESTTVSTATMRSGDETSQDSPSASICDSISLCPLAHTRDELSLGIEERWERLSRALLLASSSILDEGHNDDQDEKKDDNNETYREDSASKTSSSRIADMTRDWTDEDWIKIVHSNLAVRREASYLMFALSSKINYQLQHNDEVVLSKLRSLWARFLELPGSVVHGSAIGRETDADDTPLYDISLIVPMYRERISGIGSTLIRAFNNCKGDRKKIQVVVVHVESTLENDNGDGDVRKELILYHGQQQQQRLSREEPEEGGDHDEGKSKPTPSFWGQLKVVTIPFGKGGGRGKTLNVGAREATAPILTFLHADTRVPFGWDEQIKTALSWRKGERVTTETCGLFPHACAFTMAIDRDDANKKKFWSRSNLPPGLRGAEWLGVLRCHCGLPYGDSVLSFSRSVFDYMGGYPDQPLMEDYEVMDWLRLRSFLFSTVCKMTAKNGNTGGPNARTVAQREGIVLLKDRVWCSPRRWNKYGVAYTSLINAICIYRYRNTATTAEDLFDFYYHCNSSGTSKSKTQKTK